jgi:large subunit ribosomal protein L25
MKQFSLSGSTRESVGRQNASELRRNERIPGVLYGGSEVVHFSITEKDMDKIAASSDTLELLLDLNGTVKHAIIQDLQRHPVSDKVVHIDLLELIPGKAIKCALPVRVTGNSEGVKAGGRLAINYRKVRIFGKPEELPNEITLDISGLNIGDMIRVRDIQVTGCKVLEAEAAAVVAIQATRASIAAENAASDDKKKK